MASLTEALLYLGFPDHFLPTINVEHKRKIRATYFHELRGSERTGSNSEQFPLADLAAQAGLGRWQAQYRPRSAPIAVPIARGARPRWSLASRRRRPCTR
jgi:5-methylcytosine-specific restriction protein B